MPTKQTVKIIRTKNKKRARISLSFEFAVDDPRALQIYAGIGLCLKEALTEKEQHELLSQFDAERLKLAEASDVRS